MVTPAPGGSVGMGDMGRGVSHVHNRVRSSSLARRCELGAKGAGFAFDFLPSPGQVTLFLSVVSQTGPGRPLLPAFSARQAGGISGCSALAACRARQTQRHAASCHLASFSVSRSKCLTGNAWESPPMEHRTQKGGQRGTRGWGPLALCRLPLCLLTAWPCLAMGPAKPGPPTGRWPRAVPNGQGWGCPRVPQLLAARPCREGTPQGAPGPAVPRHSQGSTLQLPLTSVVANRLTDTQLVPAHSRIKSSATASTLYTGHNPQHD